MTMKSNDEMFESVLARLEAFEREKRRRKRIVIRFLIIPLFLMQIITIILTLIYRQPLEKMITLCLIILLIAE